MAPNTRRTAESSRRPRAAGGFPNSPIATQGRRSLEQENDDSELEDAEDRAQQELADQIQRDMTASPAPSSASQPQAQATYINPADDPVPQDSRKRIKYAARLLEKGHELTQGVSAADRSF